MVKRLKKRRDFLRIAAARRKWVAPGLILQVCPHIDGDRRPRHAPEAPEFRIGFTVSRKVGGAVVRNRARRRLRAAAERVMPACAEDGRDYVIIGRAATVGRPFEALVGDLETALTRLDSHRGRRGRGQEAEATKRQRRGAS